MKFVAGMKRKNQCEKKMLEDRIDKIQNSKDMNEGKELEKLKQRVEDKNNKEDKDAARKAMVRYGLESKRPTHFFCRMNKKTRSKAQFDSLLVEEMDDMGNVNEKSIMNQKQIDWEVRKFYWNL